MLEKTPKAKHLANTSSFEDCMGSDCTNLVRRQAACKFYPQVEPYKCCELVILQPGAVGVHVTLCQKKGIKQTTFSSYKKNVDMTTRA